MRYSRFAGFAAICLALCAGCAAPFYPSYHPSSVTIQNLTNFHYRDVYLEAHDGPIPGWESSKVNLNPGDVKAIAVPGGVLPSDTSIWFEGDQSGVGWVYLDRAIPRGYRGEIRLKMLDKTVEADTVPSGIR